jgi:hypothetical protein
MEAHCEGGQGPPWAVMPRKKKKKKNGDKTCQLKFTTRQLCTMQNTILITCTS